MSVIVILILASLCVAATFLGGFIWAVKTGQFEDTFTPSMRILAEESAEPGPTGERRTSSITGDPQRLISAVTHNQSKTTNHHEQQCLDSRET